VTGIVLSAAAAQASDIKTYAQICDSSRLRAVERADCRARMKAATDENVARDVFRTFNVKVNGGLSQ
jgi:hypothetical protein